MTSEHAPGEPLTTVAVVTRLATRLSGGDRPLGAIADALGELATTLDATRVVVAIDDAHLGRQVFTSARAPLGTEPTGLFGEPGTWTDPTGRLERAEADLVTASVGVAVHALPHDDPAPAPVEPSDALAEMALAETTFAEMTLTGAVARARDFGWTFTLALVRFDDGNHSPARIASLQTGLRPGDIVLGTGPHAVVVVLPEARDDEAAAILGTAVRAGALPRCAFGMTRCPGDGTDAAQLLAGAAERLEDAIDARHPSNRRD